MTTDRTTDSITDPITDSTTVPRGGRPQSIGVAPGLAPYSPVTFMANAQVVFGPAETPSAQAVMLLGLPPEVEPSLVFVPPEAFLFCLLSCFSFASRASMRACSLACCAPSWRAWSSSSWLAPSLPPPHPMTNTASSMVKVTEIGRAHV